MKQLLSIPHIVSISLVILFFASCSSPKALIFADRDWHLSNHYGQIIDNDSTYRIPIGDDLIPDDLWIIGNADTLSSNPRMYTYVEHLLRLSRLEDARVLFFAPKSDEMFVEIPDGYEYPKPNSMSGNMMDNNPWTCWIRDDDYESWERKPDQMYTYIYMDKKEKLLVIVDCFNYRMKPIARIQRIQTNTKNFRKKFPNQEVNSTWADITKAGHLEAVSNWIDGHRDKSFTIYRIGQQQNPVKK